MIDNLKVLCCRKRDALECLGTETTETSSSAVHTAWFDPSSHKERVWSLYWWLWDCFILCLCSQATRKQVFPMSVQTWASLSWCGGDCQSCLWVSQADGMPSFLSQAFPLYALWLSTSQNDRAGCGLRDHILRTSSGKRTERHSFSGLPEVPRKDTFKTPHELHRFSQTLLFWTNSIPQIMTQK